MTRTKTQATAEASTARDNHSSRARRETVESIIVAVILAFLFRAFVAEAFVIPTGSMAPTLQGSHKDIVCPECGYQYRTGASIENEDESQARTGTVLATTCPLCRYTLEIDPVNGDNGSFTGDRILVSKFSYELGEPDRWDVFVFKYPGNAKQNYIKRLVGLPNETLRIFHGDIYIKEDGAEQFTIERKPPHKVQAMLQTVDDTEFIAKSLIDVDWPSRWQPWTPAMEAPVEHRLSSQDLEGIDLKSPQGQELWMRYRHFIPTKHDWDVIVSGERPRGLDDWPGMLITDYYAYNDFTSNRHFAFDPDDRGELGLHWVGDLALEADVQVRSSSGSLLLDLVEGGTHYRCRIDVTTGQAVLAIEGEHGFLADDGSPIKSPRAQTEIQGPGRYHVEFANVDDQLLLWIDGDLVAFDTPTTFRSPDDQQPVWTPEDPGDLAPAGIGSDGADLHIDRLQVLRDVYYIATRPRLYEDSPTTDYQPFVTPDGVRRQYSTADILNVLSDPTRWESTQLFQTRRHEDFELGPNQFFPLGDNSPQSKDARLWGDPPYVRRELVTGKALLIYWPHALRRPIPFFPNFARMGLIR